MSARAAALHFGISRDSVRKMLSFSVPPGYRRKAEIKRPKLDGFTEIIDAWLAEDRGRNRKQRHTAKRVLERLCEEHGFTGGYTIVKDYIRERDRRGREMFVPLTHPPGHAQADFGEATVIIDGVEQKAHFFAFDLPHSDACYIRAYPAATSEAWVDGHVHAFAFFGRVPVSVLYDNDRCLVASILPDGTRKRARLFSGFLSHYLIRDRYGRPGKGNDKGGVEGLVGYARRNFMVPVPRFASWDEFNTRLEERCRKRQADILRGHGETIGQRLDRDLEAMADLPAAPFDACDQTSGRVSSQALVRYKTNDYSVPVAYGHRDVWLRGYPRLRKIGPLLLSAFTFRGPKPMAPLLTALDLLRAYYDQRHGPFGANPPMAFVKPRWKRLIETEAGVNRKVYEICVFSVLRDALRAGDVWVEGSKRYRSFDEQLLPRAAIAQADRSGPLARILDLDPDTWIKGRSERMNALLVEAEKHAATGTLPDAAIRVGKLSITPIRNATPAAARDMARQLYGLLPRLRITDLLEEVDAWTGLSESFGHLKTGHPPQEKRLLYAALIADGLNLGLTRMAEACEGASYWRLARLVDWHVRSDTYAMATGALVEIQSAAPFAHLWGDGSTSSSDGQHFHAGGPARAAAEVNIHYGSEPGVKFYTHLSDQFAAWHVKAIAAAASEAPHVLDGLLHHENRVPIREHHTDTGGFSDLVFALCALFGYRFAPRIRDLPDKRLYAFRDAPATPTLAPMITRHVREQAIRTHWPEIQRLAATILSGGITAAHAITALSATTRQSGLAAALGEIGRIERSIFTLEWMLQPDLRHRVQASLNKGEARNNLTRAVFFNRLGEIRDRSYENQQHRAAGANLIVASIILWNTVYLGRAVEALRMSGQDISDDILRHIWPLGWDHINLTGDYRWSTANPDSLDDLRPLRLERLPLQASV